MLKLLFAFGRTVYLKGFTTKYCKFNVMPQTLLATIKEINKLLAATTANGKGHIGQKATINKK